MESFTYLYGSAMAIGGISMVFMTLWLGKYRGGFGFSYTDTLFNWHPFLMTIGMVFLYGNAILIYRAFRKISKKKLKIAHAVVTIAGFLVAICGLTAVFTTHRYGNPRTPSLYSLHSWIGLSSITLMACQWICGMVVFLYPGLAVRHRERYYPVHLSLGVSTFIAAIAAAVCGLTEKAHFVLPNITELPHEGLLINAIGYLILVFGCMIVYMVTNAKFKRMPVPEDEILLRPTE